MPCSLVGQVKESTTKGVEIASRGVAIVRSALAAVAVVFVRVPSVRDVGFDVTVGG